MHLARTINSDRALQNQMNCEISERGLETLFDFVDQVIQRLLDSKIDSRIIQFCMNIYSSAILLGRQQSVLCDSGVSRQRQPLAVWVLTSFLFCQCCNSSCRVSGSGSDDNSFTFPAPIPSEKNSDHV